MRIVPCLIEAGAGLNGGAEQKSKNWSDRGLGTNDNHCMKLRDLFDFTLLAALWGASFLFMRIAAPAFGPIAIADLRTAIAALVLLSLLAWRGGVEGLAPNALRFLMLGALNSAIPFTLFAYEARSNYAGRRRFERDGALFAALIAWLWLRATGLTWMQWTLVIGFSGVLWLSADSAVSNRRRGWR